MAVAFLASGLVLSGLERRISSFLSIPGLAFVLASTSGSLISFVFGGLLLGLLLALSGFKPGHLLFRVQLGATSWPDPASG